MRTDVDLSAQAVEMSDALRAASPERDVEFDIAEGMKARGDARLLRIALENLFGNAWKFTARRAPARIAFRQSEIAGEVAYSVCDNGAGFDMAYAGKLFGAFQRLHGAQEYPGNGIGLAIVQRIIARHGGRIWAEAEPEKGATFHFVLQPEGIDRSLPLFDGDSAGGSFTWDERRCGARPGSGRR
jgi:light-regulated signal transduction histidine kinase (bacteriophytochrome)